MTRNHDILIETFLILQEPIKDFQILHRARFREGDWQERKIDEGSNSNLDLRYLWQFCLAIKNK